MKGGETNVRWLRRLIQTTAYEIRRLNVSIFCARSFHTSSPFNRCSSVYPRVLSG